MKYEDSEHEALMRQLEDQHDENREETVERLRAALDFAEKNKPRVQEYEPQY